ncbi:MAG: CheR family methyltransferase [Acidiferrobacteraceae bacterium]
MLLQPRREAAGTDHQLVITDGEFRRLSDLIRSHTGIVLSDHKRALMCSRLAKRLRHYGLNRYQDYYDLLMGSPAGEQELQAMINAITTHKTQFFRESHHFRFLFEHVLLPFRNQLRRCSPLRIWSAGTSSGEEAYSIAMTVREAIPDRPDPAVRILATDISTDTLRRAETGIYTMTLARQVPEVLLHRYFLKGQGLHDGQVSAKPELRSLIRFRHLNLMDNPWPLDSRFDVIFCRNVLIYFDQTTQRQLVSRFGSLLEPGGTLMLGHSEALHGWASDFRPVGHSIYVTEGNWRCQSE